MYPRIKEIREQKKLTQLQVSMRLEIDQSDYSKYERGVHAAPIEFYINLANIYNTSVDYILGQTDNRKRYE